MTPTGFAESPPPPPPNLFNYHLNGFLKVIFPRNIS